MSIAEGTVSANNSAWRNPWVIAWVGIVVAVVLANSVLIYFALQYNPGLVVDDYYDRGQNYEKTMLARMERNPGWKMKIEAPSTMDVGQPALVLFSITDKAGQPVDVSKVVFYAYRPSDAEADFSLPMEYEAPGRFRAEIVFPLKGVWDSLISVQHGEDEYNQAQRFIVSPGQ